MFLSDDEPVQIGWTPRETRYSDPGGKGAAGGAPVPLRRSF